jgi:putative tricarboxylic transport membrane protein
MNDGTVGARGPELAVAGFLMLLGGLVIADSLRVGAGWADDGPRSGYFPFYIGCLLLGASSWIFGKQLLRWAGDPTVFAEKAQIRQVVAVLVPMLVYVAAMFPLGIYIASAGLIAYFMWHFGKYRWRVTLPVAVGVPLFFFGVFERWFLVPLPKGPLERMLGL